MRTIRFRKFLGCCVFLIFFSAIVHLATPLVLKHKIQNLNNKDIAISLESIRPVSWNQFLAKNISIETSGAKCVVESIKFSFFIGIKEGSYGALMLLHNVQIAPTQFSINEVVFDNVEIKHSYGIDRQETYVQNASSENVSLDGVVAYDETGSIKNFNIHGQLHHNLATQLFTKFLKRLNKDEIHIPFRLKYEDHVFEVFVRERVMFRARWEV